MSSEMENAIAQLETKFGAELETLIRQQENWQHGSAYLLGVSWHKNLARLFHSRFPALQVWDIKRPFAKVGYDEELLADLVKRFTAVSSSTDLYPLSKSQIGEAIAHVIDAIPSQNRTEIHGLKPYFVDGKSLSTAHSLYHWNSVKEHFLVEMNGGLPHRVHKPDWPSKSQSATVSEANITPTTSPGPLTASTSVAPLAETSQPVNLRSSSLEIAKDETIRIWTRWFWGGGWKVFLILFLLVTVVTIVFFYYFIYSR